MFFVELQRYVQYVTSIHFHKIPPPPKKKTKPKTNKQTNNKQTNPTVHVTRWIFIFWYVQCCFVRTYISLQQQSIRGKLKPPKRKFAVNERVLCMHEVADRLQRDDKHTDIICLIKGGYKYVSQEAIFYFLTYVITPPPPANVQRCIPEVNNNHLSSCLKH